MACRRAILACRRRQKRHFGMTTRMIWHVDESFWHVDGSFWHVDGDFHYFTIYYFSLPGSFLASRGVILACRRRQPGFGMSTGTTLLACRRYFWHVDASYPAPRNPDRLSHNTTICIPQCQSRMSLLTCQQNGTGIKQPFQCNPHPEIPKAQRNYGHASRPNSP